MFGCLLVTPGAPFPVCLGAVFNHPPYKAPCSLASGESHPGLAKTVPSQLLLFQIGSVFPCTARKLGPSDA